MSKKFFETDSFAQEKANWYAKLSQEGFDDIEKGQAEYVCRPQEFTANKVQSFGGFEYYEYCQNILRDYPFPCDRDKVIFEMHAEGKSNREIADWLASRSYRPVTYRQIGNIISNVKERFGRM